jgi:hypothetical protein
VAVFKCSAKSLRDAILVAQETVAEVGSLEPAALLPAIKRWQTELYSSESLISMVSSSTRRTLRRFRGVDCVGVNPTDPVTGGKSATTRSSFSRSLGYMTAQSKMMSGRRLPVLRLNQVHKLGLKPRGLLEGIIKPKFDSPDAG